MPEEEDAIPKGAAARATCRAAVRRRDQQPDRGVEAQSSGAPRAPQVPSPGAAPTPSPPRPRRRPRRAAADRGSRAGARDGGRPVGAGRRRAPGHPATPQDAARAASDTAMTRAACVAARDRWRDLRRSRGVPSSARRAASTRSHAEARRRDAAQEVGVAQVRMQDVGRSARHAYARVRHPSVSRGSRPARGRAAPRRRGPGGDVVGAAEQEAHGQRDAGRRRNCSEMGQQGLGSAPAEPVDGDLDAHGWRRRAAADRVRRVRATAHGVKVPSPRVVFRRHRAGLQRSGTQGAPGAWRGITRDAFNRPALPMTATLAERLAAPSAMAVVLALITGGHRLEAVVELFLCAALAGSLVAPAAHPARRPAPVRANPPVGARPRRGGGRVPHDPRAGPRCRSPRRMPCCRPSWSAWPSPCCRCAGGGASRHDGRP